jgi:putrescine aminotransferase
MSPAGAEMLQLATNNETGYWQDLDRAHHLHPFTDTAALNRKGSRIITDAKGVYLWDSDGQRLLDGMAGLWCVAVGYGRQELVDAATRQMTRLPFYNTFFQTSHMPAIEAARAIAEVAPEGMRRVFFTGSGSESNDTVLRMVRHYWAQRGLPQRNIIIGRVNGYHGSTVAGASLGGMKPMHAQGGLPIPGIVHIGQPYWFGSDRSLSPDEFGLRCARELETKILELGPDRVAAFIGEPVQGAGGVIIPPATYWPEIQRICRKYGVLLVSDEVICGFGRTGSWWGCQTMGVAPDLMPIAKALTSGYLPLGGVVVRDEIAEVLETGGEFFHGFTYSGHPASCAVAAANIRIIKEERLVERVRDKIGPYFQERLRTLADHPLVGEVRGIGLLGAIELVRDKTTLERFANEGETGLLCREHCFRGGLVMRAVRDTMILSPPLVISETEVDELVTLARRALDATARARGVG